MRLFRKIFFLFAIAISILIVREFISLYNDLRNIHEYLGYFFLIFILFIFIYFAVVPVFKIFMIPKSFSPTKNKDEINTIYLKRLKRFEKNKLLQTYDFNSTKSSEQKYNESVNVLQNEVSLIRKQYISKIFYSTAVSQNGFLDAIIILSASINIVKEIFITYNGRVSNKDLFSIGRKVYTAMAIGGSEGVEYATDEIISSLASDGLKSIPFIDKIMGSIADGFVNAMLVTRISFITENYCQKVYISSDKDLLPSFKVVFDTAKIITNDVRDNIKKALKNMSTDKKENFAKFSVNPTSYVIDLAMNKYGDKITGDSKLKNNISYAMKVATNPIGVGFEKIAGLFGKKNET